MLALFIRVERLDFGFKAKIWSSRLRFEPQWGRGVLEREEEKKREKIVSPHRPRKVEKGQRNKRIRATICKIQD